ncbi:MAG: hypothetical protein WCJ61_12575 [Paludibacter sp.]
MATKLTKFPKAPKATASLAVWENYKKRCDEVNKTNAPKIASDKKKKSIIDATKKLKAKKVK